MNIRTISVFHCHQLDSTAARKLALILHLHYLFSVHDLEGLEDWDYIQGPQFSLADEDFPTLDERLTSAFHHLILPPNWNLLGDPTTGNGIYSERITVFPDGYQ